MAEIQSEALLAVAGRHSNPADIDPESIHTLALDPTCTTYRVGSLWVRVLKKEPQNPTFTTLHRDQLVNGMIGHFNRGTIDYSLHVPMSDVLEVSPGDDLIALPYAVSRPVEGESLLASLRRDGRLSEDEARGIGRMAGRFCARVHSLQVKGAGLMTKLKVGVHPGPWQKYFLTLTEAQWKRLRDSSPVEPPIIDRLADLTNRLAPLMVGETTNLVHNDLNPATIWVDRAQKKVTGFVNFTNAGAAPATADLATLFLHFSDESIWQAVIGGYSEIRSMPEKFESRLAYYGLAFGMMAAWFYHMRKDAENAGYFVHRALKLAAQFEDSFASEASRWGSFTRPAW